MKATDIHQLITLAEKLGYKATLITNTILGEGKHCVNYEDYRIDDDKIRYRSHYEVRVKDVVSVRIGK